MICANHWTKNESKVACIQIGYADSTPVLPDKLREWVKEGNYTTHGSRVEWLDDVYCDGVESELRNCHNGAGRSNILHQRYGCVRQKCSFRQEVAAVNCSKKGDQCMSSCVHMHVSRPVKEYYS